MEEDMGKGLQMKSQDELIGEEGTAKDRFVDAKSDVLSTIPRTKEEHEELNVLNNNFSERLEEVNKISSLPEEKGKTIEDKDKINKNKKCEEILGPMLGSD
ncbi:hypothetical protein RhiirA5_422579 [Rhizophagus irregularis]|uniref:Uncharacterized protein n=1 Tax=Rhizophagus irregularis TaxID=588596 RepID=A0A2N0PBK4_9GLOM|nr:hypothetical protein RhiirA5_422579 [Rhizophagus irregularis]